MKTSIARLTLLWGIFSAGAACAGVVTDGSLGAATTLAGPNYAIGPALGQIRGNNLFHSFSQFNLVKSEAAIFSGPGSITNIISRVTGGPSSIDGTIRSTVSGANVYLVNPAGIMFGPNASLDVTGSFHATTADYLQFGQERFSADPTMPLPASITVPDPTAFGFLKQNPAPVSVNGSLLQVPLGKDISLVSGGITMTDANLWSYGGGLNLVSVASPGEVGLDGSGMTPIGFGALGPVSISESRLPWNQPDYNGQYGMYGRIANLDASSQGGGRIIVRGGSFFLADATVYNDTYGNTSPGITDIRVSGDATIFRSNITGNTVDGSAMSAPISIHGTNLLISDQTQINTASYTPAKGSDITLKAAGSLVISGPDTDISAEAMHKDSRAGNLLLEGTTILIGTGGQVFTSANLYDGGPAFGAGTITINALHSLTLLGTIKSELSSGSAGAVNIRTRDLLMMDSGRISTTLLNNYPAFDLNLSPWRSGDTFITAENMVMIGDSRIESRVVKTYNGSSGDIMINTVNLSLLEHSNIVSSIDSITGFGGHINVTATGDILVASNPRITANEISSASISSDSNGGDAGNIRLEANNITITNGATLSTVALGPTGNGGSITLIAHGGLVVEGSGVERSTSNPSSVETDTLGGGSAGVIELIAPVITLKDGGLVSSASLPGSTGPAGNITIKTDQLVVDNGHISSDSVAGNAGHIGVTAADISVTNGASLSTVAQGGAGQGGNIVLKAAGSLVVAGSGDNGSSNIRTDTLGSGSAGVIELTAPRVSIKDDGLVSSASLPGSSGPAGNITVKTDQLAVNNGHISSDSAAGNAGHISVTALDISVTNGASLSTVAEGGAGQGGNVVLNAGTLLTIEGSGTKGSSNVRTDTLGSGSAGVIELTSPQISIKDGGLVSSASLPGSTGPAGNITVKAANQLAVDNGHISSDSAAGNAGHIGVTALDISVTNGASLSTVAEGGAGQGGNIVLNAGTLLTIEGSGTKGPSNVRTDTLGSGSAGVIELTSPVITVKDGGLVSSASLPGSSGPAGNITVKSDQLVVDAGHISSDSAAGNAGHIGVTAADISITNGASLSTVAEGGAGQGGNIALKADKSLTVAGTGSAGSSNVRTDTLGSGSAGVIELTAPRVTVKDGGLVSSASLPGSTGPAGNITVTAERLVVENGHISSDSAAGNAGHIGVTAEEISVTNGASLSTVAEGGAGQGGNIVLIAGKSLIVEGAGAVGSQNSGKVVKSAGAAASGPSSIRTDTLGSGSAGVIELTAPRVTVKGGGLVSSASLPGSSGPAGNITVKTDQLVVDNGHISSDSAAGNAGHIGVTATDISVTNGASLSTVAEGGAGQGGNIVLNADQSLTVAGSGSAGPSNVRTDTLGSGFAGVIELTAPRIYVRDGGLVSSASLPGSSGPAGNITVNASDQLTVDGGHVNTQSALYLGGNIYIGTPRMLKLYDGEITASATGGNGNGGNVTVDALTLIMRKGKITAQAEGGDGGNLLITVGEVFIKSADSILSASSRYGLQGTVTVNSPNTDVAGALKTPVYDILNLNSFIPKRCLSPDEDEASTFKMLGVEGLPASPENSFPNL